MIDGWIFKFWIKPILDGLIIKVKGLIKHISYWQVLRNNCLFDRFVLDDEGMLVNKGVIFGLQ